jgi:hypothetical protein
MEADTDDSGFMDGMQSLLGLHADAVEELLDILDNDSLLALTDAVANQDKEAADAIVKSFDHSHVSSLFKGKDIDHDEKKRQSIKKKPIRPPKDHEFAIGDDVAIKTTNEDTGEDDFVSATVFQPNAPGDTIGVKIEGKPKMVDQDEVFMLKEMGVMGMVGIPDIQRMQQLAGIGGQVVQEPAINQEEPAPPFEVQSHSAQAAMSALDALDHALPNVRLSDLKSIRQRIVDIQAKMNECIVSSMPAGRPRKL